MRLLRSSPATANGQSLTTPFRRSSTDAQYNCRVCGSRAVDGVVRRSDWW